MRNSATDRLKELYAIQRRNPLREWRREHDVTQGSVSALIGVSLNTVRNWETGANEPTNGHFVVMSELLERPELRQEWQAWMNELQGARV